ncbi:GyrI-like domain-containing protein [bacterium]|nr:GyrI-like domain-containing protein [bacterium]
MDKLDMKKELKQLYKPTAKQGFTIVEVPPLSYLMIDGAGDPNTSEEYQQAMEALYGLSYSLKFMLKKRPEFPAFSIMPLEGLWWAKDMEVFMQEDKESWLWTMMIAQPDFITTEMVIEASEILRKKKDVPALDLLRFDRYEEGTSAQILYLGAYADEAPTIKAMHEFIETEGYQRRGKHHEIYLGDPRRVPPERLKTILRQPIVRG